MRNTKFWKFNFLESSIFKLFEIGVLGKMKSWESLWTTVLDPLVFCVAQHSFLCSLWRQICLQINFRWRQEFFNLNRNWVSKVWPNHKIVLFLFIYVYFVVPKHFPFLFIVRLRKNFLKTLSFDDLKTIIGLWTQRFLGSIFETRSYCNLRPEIIKTEARWVCSLNTNVLGN